MRLLHVFVYGLNEHLCCFSRFWLVEVAEHTHKLAYEILDTRFWESGTSAEQDELAKYYIHKWKCDTGAYRCCRGKHEKKSIIPSGVREYSLLRINLIREFRGLSSTRKCDATILYSAILKDFLGSSTGASVVFSSSFGTESSNNVALSSVDHSLGEVGEVGDVGIATNPDPLDSDDISSFSDDIQLSAI